MNNLIIITLIVFSAFVLTELIRRYTLKKNLIDIPNERSSHSIPTPRGGGLSIVILFLGSISFVEFLSTDIFLALIGSGVIIASIGFWDDHNHVAARWRLIAHFAASFWVLYWLGGIGELQVFNYYFDTGFIGIIFVAIFLVWLLNLFNFMDGIDGFAASEATFISCAGAFISWLHGLNGLSFISLLLAASTLGFLILNWPPAKIFMGDVGSAFLGLMLGVIAYATILEGVSPWVWMILLGVFLVDSGVTLIRRIINGDKWYEAHCSHAYQHAAKKWNHKKVTVMTILVNVFWLLPLAYITYNNSSSAVFFAFIAYLPLIIVAFILKAGVSNNQQQGING